MIASLAMYDHPAQRWANEELWSALAERLHRSGVDAPTMLRQDLSVEAAWRAPDLLLAQCCGYPLVADAELSLRVLAVPHYAVADCAPGRHVSRIVVRAGEPRLDLAAFRGRVAAINAPLSNTGVNLFRDAVADIAAGEAFFAATLTTGSHRKSALAVAQGAADVTAIDAVTYAAWQRYEPDVLGGLTTIGVTRASPALPFVTSRAMPAACVTALRQALVDVARDPVLAAARDALFLSDVKPVGSHRYLALLALARSAAWRGYPQLR